MTLQPGFLSRGLARATSGLDSKFRHVGWPSIRHGTYLEFGDLENIFRLSMQEAGSTGTCARSDAVKDKKIKDLQQELAAICLTCIDCNEHRVCPESNADEALQLCVC